MADTDPTTMTTPATSAAYDTLRRYVDKSAGDPALLWAAPEHGCIDTAALAGELRTYGGGNSPAYHTLADELVVALPGRYHAGPACPGCSRRECWLCHYRDAVTFHAGQYVEYWLKPDYIVGGGWLRGVVAEMIAPRYAIVTSEATGERHRLAFDRLRCPQCGGTGEAVASEQLYGTPEAAAALDLSVEAVRKIAGQLGVGTKLRSGWVFTGAEVEAMRARPDGRAGRKMPSRRPPGMTVYSKEN